MLIREAIILAAGLGTRMRSHITGVPKPLIRVSEIPLILYTIASLLNAGVEHFHIVVNPKSYEPISEALGEIDVNVDFIINNEPERGNGYSLLLGMKNVKDRFFLSMSDHIYDPKIPIALLSANVDYDFDILIGADSNPRYVNMDEATKIFTQEGHAKQIGKNLAQYTHIDIGLFIMKRDMYDVYSNYATHNHEVELSSLIQYSIEQGKRVLIVDIHGLPWIDIDTIEDLHRARTIAKTLIERATTIVRKYIGVSQVH